jgi:hypothetical protein
LLLNLLFTIYFRVAAFFLLSVFRFRCLATVNIIQVQDALVFIVVQNADSFRSGLTTIALQSHPQTATQSYRRRRCLME